MKKILLTVLLTAMFGISCNSMADKKEVSKKTITGDGVVVSTVNGAGYTFVELKADKGNFWAATKETPIKVGDVITLKNPMLMKNFESKSLSKTFNEIYFAEGFIVNGKGNQTKEKMTSPHDSMDMGEGNEHMGDTEQVDVSKVLKAENGVTVNEILSNPANFKDKEVTLNVIVTKYLPQIMGKNWLHLKDASSKDVHIAATTAEEFNKGDIVLIKGTVILDKDFGAGYKYEVLLENVISVKK